MTELTIESLEKFVSNIKTDGMCDITDSQVESALISLLAYEQAAKNPVAWVATDSEGFHEYSGHNEFSASCGAGTPLYAAPVLPKQPEPVALIFENHAFTQLYKLEEIEIAKRTQKEAGGTITELFKGMPARSVIPKQPVMFIDGDISSGDAEKLAAVIREFGNEQPLPIHDENGLLPCPFCSGKAKKITIENESDPCFGGDVITCMDCGASSHVEYGFKENLESSWNSRENTAPAQPVIPEQPSLRYGDNVLWFLNELAAFDASDIDSDDFDVYGADRNGMEGFATISITELAADAAKLLSAQPVSEPSDSPVIPDGWKLVPIEPTENMIIDGFESEPDKTFSKPEVWEEYAEMSGCKQAAHRAKLCWAAMLSAAPTAQEQK